MAMLREEDDAAAAAAAAAAAEEDEVEQRRAKGQGLDALRGADEDAGVKAMDIPSPPLLSSYSSSRHHHHHHHHHHRRRALKTQSSSSSAWIKLGGERHRSGESPRSFGSRSMRSLSGGSSAGPGPGSARGRRRCVGLAWRGEAHGEGVGA